MTLLLLWCSTPSKEIYKDGRVEEERSKLKKRKEGRKEGRKMTARLRNGSIYLPPLLPLLPCLFFLLYSSPGLRRYMNALQYIDMYVYSY